MFKAISGRTWLAAFLLWFLITFAFIGGLEDAWGGTEPAGVIKVLSLQASLATQFFRALVERPFQVGSVLFLALLCPVFAVPSLALVGAFVSRWWERAPGVRLWFQAFAGWFVLAGVATVLSGLRAEPGGSWFFGGLFLLVFGPVIQILRFLGGPMADVLGSTWWLSLLVSPLIWVPLFHRCLRLWHRALARAGKERPLPEPHPELEDTSNEGL